MHTTTLNKIRLHTPCTEGWAKLLKTLGKTKADDEPVPLSLILQSNGLDDAIWALRCLEGVDREIRLFAVECGRQQQHLLKDPRSLAVLEVAERFANGQATSEELGAARVAAWVAAAEAQDAARVAAWVAAGAAWVADRVAARAARDAAWAAAIVAYRDAARAARDAARAARDAADAAGAKQEEIFLKYFGE